ncbi:ATP-binding cassette domain-containing protein [Streptomyces sp. NPDC048659]|uniref:ATP-binding cassette domain-containing protein n=1 Tax=Streptomyces sp. NPDC048659 TaxID=3155489 RepID=UPI003449D85E
MKRRLWHTLRGHRRPFTGVLAAEALLGGAEALLHPLFLMALFDRAVLTADLRRFLLIGGCYLLLGLALHLTGHAVALWRRRFENALVLALETELLGRALALDGRGIAERGAASYVGRVHDDVRAGVLPAVGARIGAARQGCAAVASLGVLLHLCWPAALLLPAVVPPLVLAGGRLARRAAARTGPEREAEARYVDTLTRTLESFHALRGLRSLLPGARTAHRDALRGFLALDYAHHRRARRGRTLGGLTANLPDTSALAVGALLVLGGRLSFGGFLAFAHALRGAVTALAALVGALPRPPHENAVLDRVETLRTAAPAPYHDEGTLVLVRGARVRYDARPDTTVALPDFGLRPGERVLLRGPRGCGKTTLLHIVDGTLAPDRGEITRPPRVASLTSPVRLPPLPVRALVADPRLRTALGLDGLADRLPAALSPDQRRRLGVAALLAEDADVYLADEPLADLDDPDRAHVLNLLRERTADRALLVVHQGDDDLDLLFDRVVDLTAPAGIPRAAGTPA